MLTVRPLEGIPEVTPGMDVPGLVESAVRDTVGGLDEHDVVVVTHKIVSKAEGQLVQLDNESPEHHRRLVEQEARSIIRRRGDLIIAETHHGFICANAGIDRSNTEPGTALLLPHDPDASANRIRLRLERAFGVTIGVIISDTFGRVWRRGLVDVAIGVAGMSPVVDLRGTTDDHGRPLEVTEIAIVDEVAAAADLVMGKATRTPAAIVSGVDWRPSDRGIGPMIRPPGEDLFR